mmetsp:Transcript_11133/g.18150  ORF Transcript_11133/g.18150 Transcript_11133/m.18150 type:complete len:224 (+) Transcript_11133:42-713(+)|eukprot:jgi/Bigna1/62415/fgenesh1_kg.35_\
MSGDRKMRPSIVYAFVAKGNRIAARERLGVSGQFQKAAWECLERLRENPESSKMSIPLDRFTMNFKLVDDLAFMCLATQECGKQIPFMFLKQISDAFFDKYTGEEDDHDDFNPILTKYMHKFADPKAVEKMSRIHRGLSEVKDVMVENIEKVLKRGEKIEVLVDKTESLRFSSDAFRMQSRNLRRNLCWANVKVKLFLGCLVLILFYVITASYCGMALQCFNK